MFSAFAPQYAMGCSADQTAVKAAAEIVPKTWPVIWTRGNARTVSPIAQDGNVAPMDVKGPAEIVYPVKSAILKQEPVKETAPRSATSKNVATTGAVAPAENAGPGAPVFWQESACRLSVLRSVKGSSAVSIVAETRVGFVPLVPNVPPPDSVSLETVSRPAQIEFAAPTAAAGCAVNVRSWNSASAVCVSLREAPAPKQAVGSGTIPAGVVAAPVPIQQEPSPA